MHPDVSYRGGRLTARPAPAPAAMTRGLAPLGLAPARDGWLFVPEAEPAQAGAPLLVLLHGAGADAKSVLDRVVPHAAALGLVVVAPDSRADTWDDLIGDFGPDVSFLDHALVRAFARARIDPHRIAIAGFSDGATYAVSLAAANADLFTHVLAFPSRGIAPVPPAGAPPMRVFHGVGARIVREALAWVCSAS